jgi:hypothetical protein
VNRLIWTAGLSLALAGCEVADDPTYLYGVRLSELEFVLSSTEMGIHPDRSVLADPNNPFRDGVSAETKFEVLQDGPVAGFYAWATVLAREPTGEAQFYTALQLHGVYDLALAEAPDLPFVREMAIRGYQTVLDTFPGSVTYDATGRTPFALGPLCIHGIEALGGEVQNGWVVIVTEDGSQIAVQDR